MIFHLMTGIERNRGVQILGLGFPQIQGEQLPYPAKIFFIFTGYSLAQRVGMGLNRVAKGLTIKCFFAGAKGTYKSEAFGGTGNEVPWKQVRRARRKERTK